MVARVSTGSPFEAKFGYSRAVRHRDTIYVSGTTGYDYASMTMPEEAGEQAANALETIGAALHELGSDLRDVVRVTYYVGDRADIDAIGAVTGEVFADIRPAATMVLAQLIEPEMKVEIEVTARIGAHLS
jgi:enamine deaminase RidA (YjgF/YER057c/UK114 family)